MTRRHRHPKAASRRAFLKQAGTAAVAATVSVKVTAAPGRVPGANDRIGVGLIGCGGRGRDHLNTLNHMKENGTLLDIVAVSDVYRPRMEKAAAQYKTKGYMDHRELLADPRVDVVAIATPDHIHGYQVIDAVQAGKDVYCEKPVTHWRQFELTRRMAAEVEKSGRIFQLGSQGMSDPAWHLARKLIQEGLIGQPIHAECGYFRVGDWGERGMPIDDPNAQAGPDLNWEAFLGDSPKRPFDVSRFFRWRMYEDYSGGPATDLYPHSFTPVVYMLGLKFPSTVVATGGKFRYQEREVPDTCNILVDYPEKVTVVILGTQGNNHFGSTGGRGSVGRCPTVRGWEGTLTFEGSEIVFTPAEGSQKKAQRFAVDRGEDQVRHWQDLLDCCRSRKRPASPVDLALHVQTALQMSILGWREGKAARFDAQQQKILL